MATIKAIEPRTIHQIQSGQVIVDLCSVVKELVENSVDAGATSIEVRFKNQGLDTIEVQDNGFGISPENYETLALKHYTSKLSTYSDLSTLQTFGFRGEALSSLCALSKFWVTTCLASDAPKGSKLEFATSGKLQSTSVIASQKGTTVSVEGLFHNLPVRRRELERNIKREWNRVIGVLNKYACILTGVKFSVSQQPTKGKKVVLFSTKGNNTTRDNIVNVFGAKTVTVLVPLDLQLELEPTSAPSQLRSAQEDRDAKEILVRGHVSRPAHGDGRQTPDRQMFFVNGRPCALPQFAKVFNEVYKSYNSSQSPFIFADIQLDTHMYDVNVSPDKRTIMLHDQTRMLDNLREALVRLFEAQDYAVPVSQLAVQKQPPFRKLTFSRQGTVESGRQQTETPPVEKHRSESDSQSIHPDSREPKEGRNGESREDEEVSGRRSNVSIKSLALDEQGIRLISRLKERTSSERDGSSANASTSTSREQAGEIPRLKPRLIAKFKHTNKQNSTQDISAEIADDASASEAEPDGESDETPSRIRDFNAHLEALNSTKRTTDARDDPRQRQEIEEPPIPAISTASTVAATGSSSYSQTTFKRTAPEVATITIGGDTITSVIGGPAKKPRIDKSGGQRSSDGRKSSKGSTPMPSFKGRLTQMFAASSSVKEASRDDTGTTELMDVSSRSTSPSENLFVEDKDDVDISKESQGSDEDVGSKDEQKLHYDAQSLASKEQGEEQGEEKRQSPFDSNGDDYVDEDESKAQEYIRVQNVIDAAENAANTTSEETEKRQQSFIRGVTRRKDGTSQCLQKLCMDERRLKEMASTLENNRADFDSSTDAKLSAENINASDAEEKLSLTISKSDFGKMKVVGQFNLGFILAVRAAETSLDGTDTHAKDDELFIIDQHATDEKYNFERLQASTIVQSQRLVQPKTLELTAIEEEVIKENMDALETNGFMVSIDESGYQPVGSRCQLLSLPLSRETTFSLADLEELISLLTEHQSASATTVPRPSKVRKMFAMRACRSSVMIGKPLTNKQMEKLVRHMGELDKPWNCPHGRPTMRHLGGLGAWGSAGWREGDGFDGERPGPTDWTAYVRERRGT
ncbi:uncharacterized protein BCR38DRAFT_485876 [Pseudomassariella vexata]|uniref:DNA mismatch repair protein PMS1 n=1 Tax=Pseudomassariella vexata TaxID=1141098 RepID=A0A1Y2DVF0_9PEZI|nr:uncharacterized protein BCR38DRAFT_485876 [Pseudomassariella vexata]ORY63106.1 hypothetical protein BCR38DRAFT_485876 [Pseudomassariella vexata]